MTSVFCSCLDDVSTELQFLDVFKSFFLSRNCSYQFNSRVVRTCLRATLATWTNNGELIEERPNYTFSWSSRFRRPDPYVSSVSSLTRRETRLLVIRTLASPCLELSSVQFEFCGKLFSNCILLQVHPSSCCFGLHWNLDFVATFFSSLLFLKCHYDQIFTFWFFRCITKNSMKEWKRRLPFANTYISSGDEKCVKYANKMTDDVIHSTQYYIMYINRVILANCSADHWNLVG